MSEIRAVKITTVKQDVDNLTDLQRELHFPEVEGEEIRSRFSYRPEKRSVSSRVDLKMECVSNDVPESGNERVTYKVSPKLDILEKCALHCYLPSIKVKENCKKRIQICYPRNLGHHIAYYGEFLIDKDVFAKIDSTSLDIGLQYLIKEKRDFYDIMIGNIDYLTEWTTELPCHPITVPQPWFFSKKTQTGLQILQSAKTDFEFVYLIRSKISDLLRMRIYSDKDKTWKIVPCILDYLDLKRDRIPTPELWGKYSLVSDQERKWRRSGASPEHWIEDIDITDSDNPINIGKTANIKLQSQYITKHIFIVAQNEKARENRDYSNYTTNPENIFSGWNPCASIGLKYANSFRFGKVGPEHSQSEAFDYFPAAPREPGYNVRSYSSDVSTLHADSGVVLKNLNASLTITLGDTDPFKKVVEVEEEYDEEGQLIPRQNIDTVENSGDQYTIHIRSIVQKKITVNWNGEKLEYKIVEDK